MDPRGLADRWGLLLLNTGTPAAPEPAAVRRYLREFLSDPRVMDIAAWKRALLLNAVILPFRPRRSAAAYREIWTAEGSPLLVHGRALVRKLQAALGEGAVVTQAMRYGEPGIARALDELQAGGVDRVVCLPLFPQYASSSWGSTVEKLYAEAGCLTNVPSLRVLPPYYAHPAFVRACAATMRPVLDDPRPERVLFSFHGLPERHVRRGDPTGSWCLEAAGCCDAIGKKNRFCYRAQCFATARALAAELGLEPDGWEVAFQSRLGRLPWIGPHTDRRLEELARDGVKRLAIAAPSFVIDCLETLEELGIRGRQAFLDRGGEELRLAPALNSHDAWVEAVVEMVAEEAPGAA